MCHPACSSPSSGSALSNAWMSEATSLSSLFLGSLSALSQTKFFVKRSKIPTSDCFLLEIHWHIGESDSVPGHRHNYNFFFRVRHLN